MSRYGNISLKDRLLGIFRNGNMITRLIFINVTVFLVINLFFVILILFHSDFLVTWIPTGNGSEIPIFELQRWLTAPSDFGELLYQPWTFLTYQFMHAGVLHLLFNMITLFFLGRIFNEFLGNRKVLTTYIMGGIAGWLLFALGYNFLPIAESEWPHLIGASASIMAIVAGIATYMPNHTINLILIGPIKLIWLALIFVALDLLRLQALGGMGTGLSHLGGAAWGYLVFSQIRKGRDLNAPFERIIFGIPALFKPKAKIRVEHRTTSRPKPRANTAPPRSAKTASKSGSKAAMDRNERQARIDAILDKISRSGYDSLTKAEKEFLFKVSDEK